MSVLLVDSVGAALDTQESFLEPFDFYRIWTAKKADEAMEVLRERPINLVITAWKLQPLSGMQLVEMIRKAPDYAELPVIMVADQLDKTMQEKADALQVHQVLKHPLKPETYREAVTKALESSVDFEEEQFMAHMDAARKAKRQGRLDEAEEAYRAALGVKMAEDAHNGLAAVLVAKGDPVGAGRCFMEALKANPLSLKAFLGLAHIYQARDRLPDALKILARAVDAAKKLKEGSALRASILFYMGELELQLKNLKAALGYFDQAVETSPEDTKLQTDIGDTLAEAGHNEASEEYYRRALVMDPELAHVYNRLAIAYRRQEKYDMAIDLYYKALAFHPDDENLMYNMARCFWEMGDWDQAGEKLKQALELNPEFAAATELLQAIQRQKQG